MGGRLKGSAAVALALALAGCGPDVLRPPVNEVANPPPRALVVPTTWSQVESGGYTVCGVRATDHTVVCWSDNSQGDTDVPADLGAALQVSTGSGHTCAIRQSDGTVACWGRNDYGQTVVPTGLSAVKQVAAGGINTCAIRDADGALVCWGSNIYGESNVPPELGAATQVQPGARHSCAIRSSDGALLCWGQNWWGQITVPPELGAATQVAGRNIHTCAIRQSDHALLCWGWNAYGQTNVPPDLGPVTRVTGGNFHTCAIRQADGSVVCWGRGDYGQTTVPPELGAATQVTAGGYYTCALRSSDGAVLCWGWNLEGVTNVPTMHVLPTATFSAPTPVDEGSSILLSLGNAQVPGHDGSPFTYAFDCGDGAGLGPFGSDDTRACPTADDATRAVQGVVRDRDGDTQSYPATVIVRNVAPTITALAPTDGGTAPMQLVAGAASVTMQLAFSDPAGSNDTYSAAIPCGNGTTATATAITSPAALSCTYTAPGIYTVRATVSDEDDGTSAEAVYQYVVVYEPEGASTAGGGLFADPASGRTAHFAFTVRFLPGQATAPEGSVRFWVPTQPIHFESGAIEMLVVSGNRAQFWGTGTWNGTTGARIRITAVDGQLPGSDGTMDAIRVEVWDAAGARVYDTQAGAPRDAPVTTAITAGNIRIR